MCFDDLASWLRWQESLHPNAIDLGLERVRQVLDRLGWTRPNYPIVTIGGTKGKGSSVALLERVLSAAGYRIGALTSPHLRRYNERIRIAEQEISDASLIAAFERIDAARGDVSLTFFEFNTLAALLTFATAGLDVLLLEVGLGGRLDAVNVVDPDIAVVTSVALDHCEWLGYDVESIGREKAGIYRGHRPALFGSLNPPASVVQKARELHAEFLQLGVDFHYTLDAREWNWQMREHRIEHLPLPKLFGATQVNNAATCLAVLQCLSARVPVTRAAIDQGLRSVNLLGRFQSVATRQRLWILDVAHNPASAHTLADNLRALPTAGRTVAVCGILGDKDIEAIAEELAPFIDEWIVVPLPSLRALPPQTLAQRLGGGGATCVVVESSIEAAAVAACARTTAQDRIVVFGSFLTVGPMLDWLEE